MPVEKALVRLATAGSVDDGKSTLIGRLLYETNSLYEDQIVAIREATERRGEKGFNLALVTDGLRAEREQNITIDVAYRPFSSHRRRFILADSPGHAQYTRNMVTAASTADIVIVLVDASRGPTAQSRRHLAIAALLRAPVVLLVVNKMDLVGFDQTTFDRIRDELLEFGRQLGAKSLSSIPISAKHGDNVVTASTNMPWYDGPTLLDFIDTVEIPAPIAGIAKLPVQNVLRGHDQARFFAGTLAGGRLEVGQSIRSSSDQASSIRTITIGGNPVESADVGSPIAVQLADEIDVSRGDWLLEGSSDPAKAKTLRATLFWFGPDTLRLAMTYRMRQGPRELLAQVTRLRDQLNFEDDRPMPVGSLAMNDVGYVDMTLAHESYVELYENDRNLGSFVLIDSHNHTVAAGRLDGFDVTDASAVRERQAKVVWLTGLSGAGKSTLSDAVHEALKARGVPSVQLDGDALRTGLCSDLGFSEEDRLENIRRAAEVARLLTHEGFVTLCAFISPLAAQRDKAREILGERFLEVFVKCDLDECIRRDPKGLYARAISGSVPNFTGVSSPYEEPQSPDLVLDTQALSLAECVERVLAFLSKADPA